MRRQNIKHGEEGVRNVMHILDSMYENSYIYPKHAKYCNVRGRVVLKNPIPVRGSVLTVSNSIMVFVPNSSKIKISELAINSNPYSIAELVLVVNETRKVTISYPFLSLPLANLYFSSGGKIDGACYSSNAVKEFVETVFMLTRELMNDPRTRFVRIEDAFTRPTIPVGVLIDFTGIRGVEFIAVIREFDRYYLHLLGSELNDYIEVEIGNNSIHEISLDPATFSKLPVAKKIQRALSNVVITYKSFLNTLKYVHLGVSTYLV